MRDRNRLSRALEVLALGALVLGAAACSEDADSGAEAQTDAEAAGGEGGQGGGAGEGGAGGAGGEIDTALSALEINQADELTRYRTAGLSLTAIYADGRREAVTEGITWASADDDIATVDAEGTATGVHKGPVTVSATFGGLTAERQVEVGCRYPNFPNAVRFNNTMPALGWRGAKYYELGGESSDIDFTFENFYCDREWDQFDSMVVMIKAAWCTPCTQYAQNRLNPAAALLFNDRALTVYVEAQDFDGTPADNAFADSHMRRLISNGYGVRVGDASTMATVPADTALPAYLQDSNIVTAFPTILVVRKDGMKVIAESQRTQFSLPLLDIVENLYADWSDPQPMFNNRCTEGDDEATEPNNTPEQAPTLAPGTFNGGICTAEPDIFRVDIEGAWAAQIDFSEATGDLDMAVVNPDTLEALTISNGTTGTERVEWTGPALVQVFGYSGASAPYVFTLEAAN